MPVQHDIVCEGRELLRIDDLKTIETQLAAVQQGRVSAPVDQQILRLERLGECPRGGGLGLESVAKGQRLSRQVARLAILEQRYTFISRRRNPVRSSVDRQGKPVRIDGRNEAERVAADIGRKIGFFGPLPVRDEQIGTLKAEDLQGVNALLAQ